MEVFPCYISHENDAEEEDFDIDMPIGVPTTSHLSCLSSCLNGCHLSSSSLPTNADYQHIITSIPCQTISTISSTNDIHYNRVALDDPTSNATDQGVLCSTLKRQRQEVIDIDDDDYDFELLDEMINDEQCTTVQVSDTTNRKYNTYMDKGRHSENGVPLEVRTVQGIFKSHWAKQKKRYMMYREVTPVLTRQQVSGPNPLTGSVDKYCMYPLVDDMGRGYYVKKEGGDNSRGNPNEVLDEEGLVTHYASARYQMSPEEENRYKRLINIENWSDTTTSSDKNQFGVENTKQTHFPDVLLPSAFVETVDEHLHSELDTQIREDKGNCNVVIDSTAVSSLPAAHINPFHQTHRDIKSVNNTLLRLHQIEGVRFIWKCLVDAPPEAGGYGGSAFSNGTHLRRGTVVPDRNGQSYYSTRGSKKHPISAYGCILAHSMGLGKSCQVVVFLNLYHQYIKKNATIVLVVPKSTLFSWRNEFKRWSRPFIDQRSGDAEVDKGHKDRAQAVHYMSPNNTITPEAPSSNQYTCDTPFPLYLFDDQLKITEKLDAANKWTKTGGVMLIGYEGLLSLQKDLDSFTRGGGSKKRKRKVCRIISGYQESSQAFVHPLITKGLKVDIVVCDEAHKLKNNKLGVVHSLSRLSATMRLLLTGTPLQNHLMEYWAMLSFAMPNFFENRWFQNFFVSPIVRSMKGTHVNESDILLAKQRIYTLIKEVEPFVQRRDATPLKNELPPLYEYVILIGMSPVQKRLYVDFLDFVMKIKHQSGYYNLLQSMSYSNKICAHPKVLYRSKSCTTNAMTPKRENPFTKFFIPSSADCDAAASESSKFVVAIEIIKLAMKSKEKTLVFSLSTLLLDVFQECLVKEIPSCNYTRIDGSTTSEQRASIIGKFQNEHNINNVGEREDEEVQCNMYSYDAGNPNIDSASIISNAITDVLILSTKAGSVGLTLTAASRVIILDSSFNPVDDRQAIGRVYRYGQRKPVYAYRLICEDTMEHRLLYQKIAKEWLFRSVVDRNEVKRNEFLEIHLVDIVEKLWAKHRRKSVTDVFNVDDEVDQYGVSIPTTKTPNPSFSYNTSEGNSHMNDRLSSVCFLQDPKVLRVLANLFIHVSQHECFFEPDDEESELMFYENYCRTELLDIANGSLENGNDITEKEMKRKEVTKVSDKTDVAKETQVSASIIGGGGWEVRDNRSKHDSKEQEGQNRVGLSVRGETVGTNETQIAEKKMRRLMRGKISLSSVIDQLLRERREKINQKIMPDKQKDLILLDDNPNLSLSHSATEQGVLLPSNTSVGADVANTVTPRVVNSQQSARYLRMAFGNRCGALFQNGKWNIESYDTYAQLPFKSASDGTVTIIDSDDEE